MEWIRAEIKPEKHDMYLVAAERSGVWVGFYFPRSEEWLDEEGRKINPTHYMPLPEPPDV